MKTLTALFVLGLLTPPSMAGGRYITIGRGPIYNVPQYRPYPRYSGDYGQAYGAWPAGPQFIPYPATSYPNYRQDYGQWQPMYESGWQPMTTYHSYQPTIIYQSTPDYSGEEIYSPSTGGCPTCNPQRRTLQRQIIAPTERRATSPEIREVFPQKEWASYRKTYPLFQKNPGTLLVLISTASCQNCPGIKRFLNQTTTLEKLSVFPYLTILEQHEDPETADRLFKSVGIENPAYPTLIVFQNEQGQGNRVYEGTTEIEQMIRDLQR